MGRAILKPFIQLHNHTEYSLLDGCGKIDDFVERAGVLGHSHFAVTEHGSMRSFYKLTIACKKHGKVKPIYGIEFYMSDDIRVKSLPGDVKAQLATQHTGTKLRKAINEEERKRAIRPRHHLCAYAKNEEGLRNLFRLSSVSWIDGFYYRPRIDKHELLKYKEGIVVSSACVAGVVPSLLLEGKFAEAVEEAEWWKANFGDDFYLEIMPHTFQEQLDLTPRLVKLAKGLDIKLIATNDCHYILKENALHQEILLCIQMNDRMSNPHRFKFDTQEFWFKTRDEMEHNFVWEHDITNNDIQAALDNTLEIVEKCDAKVVLDKFKCLVPPIVIPENIKKKAKSDLAAQRQYLHQLCLEGWEWRDLDTQITQKAETLGVDQDEHYKVYVDRLKLELTAMERQKFCGYFILVHELFKWVRTQDIMCGPGRGSSAGSLVCYLLGITSIDPIEHELLFERFMSPARIDMPDIDMDFEDVRREDIIQHLRDKYGEDNCAQIGTVIAMKGKLCLRDVCRVLEVPLVEVSAVTSSIVERSSGDERASQTVQDSFDEFDVCREFSQKYPDVLPIVMELEGQARQTGMHAAGVLTSPVPIRDILPIETKAVGNRRIRVAAIDFWGCEDMGLLKLDILGLRTLSVLKDALKAIEERHGEKIDLERLSLDNPEVLQGFTDRNFPGTFQFDTTAMYKTCEGIEFTSFSDIAAITALNRPGTMRSGLAQQYIERKNDPSKKKSIHPIYDKICEKTEGVLVYQEQLTKIFIEMAGYEPGTADSLRKVVAKKHGDETLGKEREKFVKGALERGVPEDVANDLMSKMTFFGSYAFNLSHSCAYGMIAYWTMFLKVFYSTEFMWATLKNEPDRKEVTRFIKEARSSGIEVLGPDVNQSGVKFTIDGDKIRCSLLDIKGVGEKAIAGIVSNQPFTSLSDFFKRVDRRLVKRNIVTALVKAGAMGDLVPNTKYFFEYAFSTLNGDKDLFWLASKEKWDEIDKAIKESRSAPDYEKTERALLAAEVSPLPLGLHPMEVYKDVLKGLGKHVKFVKMSDPELFDKHTYAYFNGQIVDIRYNQVGDFHSGGKEPSEIEKLKMRWGARYSNFNVEDDSGQWQRVKMDVDSFPIFRHIIDKGIGTPVIFRAQLSSRGNWKTIRVFNMVDLNVLRIKMLGDKPLTYWERYFVEHPVDRLLDGKKPVEKSRQRRGRVWLTGLIINARHTVDKNGNEMCFFELDTVKKIYKVVCFASSYSKHQHKIQIGMVGRFDILKQQSGLMLDDYSEIEIFQAFSLRAPYNNT